MIDKIKNCFKDSKKVYLSLTVLGLIVIVLIGYFYFKNKEVATLNNEGNEVATTTNEIILNNSLIIEDQAPGFVVNVNKAVLEESGWIVVYSSEEGNPGSILGAQFLPSGTHENRTVTLLVGTAPEETYYASIHSDDGYIFETQYGRHVFDYTKDLPIEDKTGNKITTSFKTISAGSRGL